VKVDEKKYLTPSQKKKIAYINQEFHSTADTVNAYIVFAHPVDPEARPDNLPPLPATMDPYQAALQVSQKADGSLFMERMIRVDLAKRAKAGTSILDDTSTVSVPLNRETDSQLSIFVGNLEFGSKEDDLRVFFEGLMCTERGPPLEGETPDGEDDGDATKKPLAWVTRVRIIRDKDTQLGKGFAYLQFAVQFSSLIILSSILINLLQDRECVDEVLAMEESKLKFAKRKLRVQRCKRIPEGLKNGVAHSTATKSQAKSKQTSSRSTGDIVVPKGDPSLGMKLAGLSKEERKKLKSMDSDRKTRRLAKKKARMSMASNVAKDRKRVRSKG
jgi:nucleolar protein 12